MFAWNLVPVYRQKYTYVPNLRVSGFKNTWKSRSLFKAATFALPTNRVKNLSFKNKQNNMSPFRY